MVKRGFQVLNSGPLATREHVLAAARKAEALGYDALVVTDHVVIPPRVDPPPPATATRRTPAPARAAACCAPGGAGGAGSGSARACSCCRTGTRC